MKRALLAAALLAGACERKPPPPAPVVIDVRVGAHALELAFEPAAPVLSAKRTLDRVTLELDATRLPARIKLSAPGACDRELPLDGVGPGDHRSVKLPAFLVANAGDAAQLGFGQSFAISLTPGCREALAGRVTWRQVSGDPIETRAENNGFVLRGRTRPASGALPSPLPWGVVPVSPRTRGAATFEAEWRSGGRREVVRVEIAAAARALGLPSVALGQRLVLGGSGWHVKTPARNGHAAVGDSGGLATFQPDARGRWLLADGDGRELGIVAGSHTETPLDCGRSDCHASAAAGAAATKMTSILFRSLCGEFPSLPDDCAVGCHTAGEPGLADGGFSAVRNELGLEGVWPPSWEALPRPLRRLGGVTCTACHGPGAIPEPTARWTILRADVCAVCHDAPPRYPHVQAWRTTRMSRADQDEKARRDPECRSCHTTAGFLDARGVRKDLGDVPSDLVLGIACAACHAAHGAHLGTALVRDFAPPAILGPVPPSFDSSRVCLHCHEKTAARTLLGGSEPPHAAVPRGCLGCHGRAPAAPRDRGAGHDFRAETPRCTNGCHEGGVPARDPALRRRAEALFEKLARKKLDAARPPHAEGGEGSRGQALEDVLIVLEDPAADVHNPSWAKALLDRAEGVTAP